MPPIWPKHHNKARLYKKEFCSEFKVSPNGELFCTLCCTRVSCDKRFWVQQHCTTAKHRKCSGSDKDSTSMSAKTGENTKKMYKQTFMPKTKKDFKTQLVEAFLLADIPLKKIRNPLIVQLFMNLGQAVPSKTICREHVHELDIPRENFVLLLSDAASYMTACTAALKVLYPYRFHVTCTAHMLHNCVEKVRSYFTEVDNLVARVKAATVKNKTRRSLFKDIGSSPEPVVTRWGTWLEAAEYYADNPTAVTKIVSSFDDET